MRQIPLNREILKSRLSYIEDSVKSLERFKGKSFKEFHANSDNFRITYYDLHRALEATMDIGSHILSRIPGTRATSYREIPLLLEGLAKVIKKQKCHSEQSEESFKINVF